jgi:glycosyltransferase involved in cell wall biosynthesis
MSNAHRPGLAYVVASEMTLKAFLLDHIRGARERFEVKAIANAKAGADIGIEVLQVGIERQISVLADLRALFTLVGVFRREKFDVVHSVTPKAGLLAALAGAVTGVPVRIHTFTGQVWATRRGAMRLLLKRLDRLTASLATHVLADSASQRDFMIAEGVVAADKVSVLGQGSVNGVDAQRFHPDEGTRAAVRAEHGVPAGAPLFLYLGRLSRDKGLLDLAQAFAAQESGWLLLVGPDEEGLAPQIRAAAGAAAGRLRLAGYTDQPERYMAAADVFVLPSYREGFGSVVLEAAAAGVPAIANRIYGLTDAVVEGETGLLVPPRDVPALARAMRELALDSSRRQALGRAARERALRDFRPADLTRALLAYYDAALQGHA